MSARGCASWPRLGSLLLCVLLALCLWGCASPGPVYGNAE